MSATEPPTAWNWLFRAEWEKLFQKEWLLDQIRGIALLSDLNQQTVPVLDWMEKTLLKHCLGQDRFQSDLKAFLGIWNEDCFGPNAKRAASRMLVRLLRLPGLRPKEAELVQGQLDARLQEPESGLYAPDTSKLELTSRQITPFINWENEHNLGRHRLLFPIYIEPQINMHGAAVGTPVPFGDGALVAAKVSLVKAEGAPPGVGNKAFVLAPWSWLAWEDTSHTTFGKMTEDLCKALKKTKTKTLTEGGPTGCQVDGRPVVFVIDLQLLSVKEDFTAQDPKDEADLERLQKWAWACGPCCIAVGGASMSLTLAFSAHAVSKCLAVMPLIATGHVLDTSEIRDVAEPDHKCDAITRFRALSDINWLIVFPSAWDKSKLDKLGERYRPKNPANLDAAFELAVLTDGFDAYRIELGVQGTAPASGVAVQLKPNHELLSTAKDEEPPPGGNGYIKADRDAAQVVCERLAQCFRDGYPDSAIPRDDALH